MPRCVCMYVMSIRWQAGLKTTQEMNTYYQLLLLNMYEIMLRVQPEPPSMYVCMYVCMYVPSMHACMHVCMYVCLKTTRDEY